MSPQEQKEINEAIEKLAGAARGITPFVLKLGRTSRVPFPNGWIRRINELRPRWPYLPDDKQRTLACMVQLCDVYRWHLNVWDLGLTAGTAHEWMCAIPVIGVIEMLMVQYGRQQGWFSKNGKVKFSTAIDRFQTKNVISEPLQKELHELREIRNGIHLERRPKVECYDGKPKTYNRAVKALAVLEKAIAFHNMLPG